MILFLSCKKQEDVNVAVCFVSYHSSQSFPFKPEFKDKLSPIFFSMNYSLADSQDAVLHGQSVAFGQVKAGTYSFCCYNGTYLLTLTC